MTETVNFVRVEVQEFDVVIECQQGETFNDAARRKGLKIATACGGEGKCKSCAVRVVSGAVPEPLLDECDIFSKAQLSNGWRRSCQMIPSGDCTIHVPRRSLMANSRHMVAGEMFERLPVEQMVGIASDRPLGIAIDLGTTNIVAFLINLKTGTTITAITTSNPQAPFGGDVVTRLTRAIRDERDRERLRQVIVDGVNSLIDELCANAIAEPAAVLDVVIAGNTAMHHLFAGLPVKQLAKAPFVPAEKQAMDIAAQGVGLHAAPGALVHFPGIIAGYVGSDHTAALLASRSTFQNGLTLVVDIGTNTEITIVEESRMIAASCPSGPALEGGEITYGMPAMEGAIEAVEITKNELKLKTIEDAPPIGICGSGVLDIVAQLHLNGVVNARGRLDQNHPRVVSRGDRLEFVVVEDDGSVEGQVCFTQDDIRAVQLAKAAIRAGIDLLLNAVGKTESQLDGVIVAGAFGNYIDLKSAISVGLLPSIPLSRFEQVGNAAGRGASLALVSRKEREAGRELAANASYLELSGHEAFMKAFVGRINFDPLNDAQSIRK